MTADKKQVAVCVDNSNYKIDLIFRKIYDGIPVMNSSHCDLFPEKNPNARPPSHP